MNFFFNLVRISGRRVLAAYFNLFLHSCTGSALPSTGHTRFDEQHDYKALFERVMHTHQLGEYVGGAWKIEEVMRWLPANVRFSFSFRVSYSCL